MRKMMLTMLIVIAVSLAFGGTSRSTTESGKPSLAWMEAYVGTPSGDVVGNPRFAADVKAYLPHILIPLGGKPDTPERAARSNLVLSQTVYMQNGFVSAGGCMVHACNLDAVLVLANPKSPSLTLAFATQGGGPMKLFVDSSEPSSILSDPQVLTIFRKWLQDNSIRRVDETLFAGISGFSAVRTPTLLQSIPPNAALLP